MTRSLSLAISAALLDVALFAVVGLALVHAAPPSAAPVMLGNAPVSMSHYGAYVTTGTLTATLTTTPTMRPTFDATIQALIRTATAVRLATSGTLVSATETRAALLTAAAPTVTPTQPVSPTYTLTPTATITFTPGVTATIRPTRTVAPSATPTPTLPHEWGVDALCRCHVPPLPPGPDCERLKALYVRDVLAAWATQTTLARGTDTPTPAVRPSLTVPTVTSPPTPAPSATRTATDEATPTAAATAGHGGVVFMPMLIVRRPRR